MKLTNILYLVDKEIWGIILSHQKVYFCPQNIKFLILKAMLVLFVYFHSMFGIVQMFP